MKAIILSLSILISWQVHAATLNFRAEQTLNLCPPGAIYILLECKEISTVKTDEVIQMPFDEPGTFAQGSWDQTLESGIHSSILASRYNNVYIGETLALIVTVGFESENSLNTELFTEMDPEHPVKTIYLIGKRKPLGNLELVPTLSLDNLKYNQNTVTVPFKFN